MPAPLSAVLPAARPLAAGGVGAVGLRHRLTAVALGGLSLAAVLATPAQAAPPAGRPYSLTATQERTVLKLIDDICGDTWCEGDHAFRFQRFSCDRRRASCTLRLQLSSWSEEPRRWRTRSPRISGFPRYRDMVATGPGGGRSLQPAFYEAVGDAVRAAEATVP